MKVLPMKLLATQWFNSLFAWQIIKTMFGTRIAIDNVNGPVHKFSSTVICDAEWIGA